MYNKVPPVIDSVGVNSLEKFRILIFFTVLVFFNNLDSGISCFEQIFKILKIF